MLIQNIKVHKKVNSKVEEIIDFIVAQLTDEELQLLAINERNWHISFKEQMIYFYGNKHTKYSFNKSKMHVIIKISSNEILIKQHEFVKSWKFLFQKKKSIKSFLKQWISIIFNLLSKSGKVQIWK